jgi:hypothetical protein
MTPAHLKQIAARYGGPRKMASIMRVGKDYIYRRINGEVPIGYKDELAIRALDDVLEEQAE